MVCVYSVNSKELHKLLRNYKNNFQLQKPHTKEMYFKPFSVHPSVFHEFDTLCDCVWISTLETQSLKFDTQRRIMYLSYCTSAINCVLLLNIVQYLFLESFRTSLLCCSKHSLPLLIVSQPVLFCDLHDSLYFLARKNKGHFISGTLYTLCSFCRNILDLK